MLLLHALETLLLCHALPGFSGGLARWLYSVRRSQYRGRRAWRRMVSDILGGLLVGVVMGPALSLAARIPPGPFSTLAALESLPSWLAWRWLISAALGFSWLAILETAGDEVTKVVREWFQGKDKDNDKDKKKDKDQDSGSDKKGDA